MNLHLISTEQFDNVAHDPKGNLTWRRKMKWITQADGSGCEWITSKSGFYSNLNKWTGARQVLADPHESTISTGFSCLRQGMEWMKNSIKLRIALRPDDLKAQGQVNELPDHGRHAQLLLHSLNRLLAHSNHNRSLLTTKKNRDRRLFGNGNQIIELRHRAKRQGPRRRLPFISQWNCKILRLGSLSLRHLADKTDLGVGDITFWLKDPPTRVLLSNFSGSNVVCCSVPNDRNLLFNRPSSGIECVHPILV